MEQQKPILDQVVSFFREGFYSVNAVEGLIIALVAAFLLTGWTRLWAVALGATVVNVIADVLIPVIANHADMVLPPLVEVGFWRHVLVLFLGYLVIIALFYYLRRTLFGHRS
jgi:hypothetical protein